MATSLKSLLSHTLLMISFKYVPFSNQQKCTTTPGSPLHTYLSGIVQLPAQHREYFETKLVQIYMYAGTFSGLFRDVDVCVCLWMEFMYKCPTCCKQTLRMLHYIGNAPSPSVIVVATAFNIFRLLMLILILVLSLLLLSFLQLLRQIQTASTS